MPIGDCSSNDTDTDGLGVNVDSGGVIDELIYCPVHDHSDVWSDIYDPQTRFEILFRFHSFNRR